MANSRTYAVPLDFSPASTSALSLAVKMAREDKGKLLLIHVITEPAGMVPLQFRERYYQDLEREAQQKLKRLRLDRKVGKGNYRVVLLKGSDPARLIAAQAKKSRASMIIMGSRGRRGLERVILGSVAEKTLRYAECPVLIVKKPI